MKIKRLPKLNLPPLEPEVGSKIRRAREECGLSQGELAKELGLCSATAVCLLESNKRKTSAITLWKISQITNLPITFFI